MALQSGNLRQYRNLARTLKADDSASLIISLMLRPHPRTASHRLETDCSSAQLLTHDAIAEITPLQVKHERDSWLYEIRL